MISYIFCEKQKSRHFFIELEVFYQKQYKANFFFLFELKLMQSAILIDF